MMTIYTHGCIHQNKLYYHMKGCLQFMHDLWHAMYQTYIQILLLELDQILWIYKVGPEDKFNPFTTHQEFYMNEDGICLSI